MRCWAADHQPVSLRIFISMSPPSVATVWHDLLKSEAAKCRPYLSEKRLLSRNQFILEMEKVAYDENQRNVQPELIRLGHAYKAVNRFADAARSPFQADLKAEDILKPVWDIAFALIQVIYTPIQCSISLTQLLKRGLSDGAKLNELVDCVTKLDGQIPDVDPGGDTLANVPDLYAPLQSIFVQHVDAYLKLIKLLGEKLLRRNDLSRC